MRTLADLLRAPDGLMFLAERGVFADRAAFLAALGRPAKPDLAARLGVDPKRPLVYVGQQVCTDYAPATASKFALARDLSRETGVVATILWHDMYQADADRFGTRILPPGGAKTRGLWLVPRNSGSGEPRFLPLERERLEEVFTSLRAWVDLATLGRTGDEQPARSRLDELIQAVRARAPLTLADATTAMAEHLLRTQLGFAPPTTTASAMRKAGLFDEPLNDVLANLDAVRSAFNRAVEGLLAQDIDPQVRVLREDYLPLHYCDPLSGERSRMRYERSGSDHWALTSNRRGEIRRFHLGGGRPSLGELAADSRWSLDVSMPLYHNDLASGWIAGRSTALYGLVFNAVLRDVLARAPIPALVPTALSDDDGNSAHTLLFDHLLGPAAAATP